MRTRAPIRLKTTARDSYFQLVRRFPLISINDDTHLKEAQQVMDQVLAQGDLDEGSQEYVDALSDLVAVYENAHHEIEPASDADMLRHFMEAKGITQTELSRETKISKSIISEVLAGKRPFSRQMIRALSRYFNVSVSVLATNF